MGMHGCFGGAGGPGGEDSGVPSGLPNLPAGDVSQRFFVLPKGEPSVAIVGVAIGFLTFHTELASGDPNLAAPRGVLVGGAAEGI